MEVFVVVVVVVFWLFCFVFPNWPWSKDVSLDLTYIQQHKCYKKPTAHRAHGNNGRIPITKIYTSKTNFHICYTYLQTLYHWG